MELLLIIALAVLFAVFLWWLLIETEGVYLGRRVVIWLYDLYARRYDRTKAFHPEYEHAFLANPIMEMIAPHQSPLVLDVATGTGRLPDALLNHVHFQGRVIGIDLSRKMLEQAAFKMAADAQHVKWIWCPAEQLPFEDNSFDVVTCLESLEFMQNRMHVLQEMARVLRPGGLLLLTNRIGTRLMPGKVQDTESLTALLEDCGIEDPLVEPWQVDYQRVWGLKAGDSNPVGKRPLQEVLCCPRCNNRFDEHWTCEGCAVQISRQDPVIGLYPLYPH